MYSSGLASKATKRNSAGVVVFFVALTVVFIALKLTGLVAWSWWWVVAPLWAPPLIVFLIIAAYLAIVASSFNSRGR